MNTAASTTTTLIVVPQVLILPPHLITTRDAVLSCNKDDTSIAACIAPAVSAKGLAVAVVLVVIADQRVDGMVAVFDLESAQATDTAAFAVVCCWLFCWSRLTCDSGGGVTIVVMACQNASGRKPEHGSKKALDYVPRVGIGYNLLRAQSN